VLLLTNVLRSYKAYIGVKLSSGGGLGDGFNVYTDEHIREKKDVTDPALYLVDTHILPTETLLPFVAVGRPTWQARIVELGSGRGSEWEFRTHIYGISLLQRDDIARHISDYSVISKIPIYDYTTGTLQEYGYVDPGRTLVYQPNLSSVETFEGTWRLRTIVRHIFYTVS